MKHYPKGTELYEKEKQLAEYSAMDRVVAVDELKRSLMATESDMFRFKTGLPTLDRLLDGVEAGELIIVTGPTGEGKTTLLMTTTANGADQGVNSLWFTLEVTPRQFVNKLSQRTAEPPLFYIPNAGFDDTDQPYVKAWEAKHRRKFTLLDWIEERIIETKVKYDTEDKKLQAVYIDHLQMIYSTESFKQNMSLELGDMTAQIKSLALHYGIVIFLIAHSKDPAEGSNREPRKQDIRDSGLISRIADTIIGVWRIPNESDGSQTVLKALKEGDNKAKIRVMKNRRTGIVGYFTAYHKSHYLTEDPF